MRAYLEYFIVELKVCLQYRTSAIAGILTQFFWGFFNIMLYDTLYSYTSSTLSINYAELVSYVWLNQAFFALIYIPAKDADITNAMKTGTVAYEIARPYHLYFWWYVKVLAKKYASVLLRFLPIIIVSLLLPHPYHLNMPSSMSSFGLFILSLVLGSFVLTGVNMIVITIAFYMNHEGGVSSIIYLIIGILSGFAIPLPLMPDKIQMVANMLPFRFISDYPFRVYSGNIPISDALSSIYLQVIWIFIIILFGYLLMNKIMKKVSVQGG